MKKHLSNILLVLILLTGVSLLLYPTVSDYWNSFHQSRAIASYTDAVASMDDEEYERLWEQAVSYNLALWYKPNRFSLSEEDWAEYESLLNISGNGIMGYITIPSIDVKLPIYHGVGEAVLQVAVGHLEISSLPVGGAGTHCVLSGHRGLPSARLFTDLDKLKEGDIFTLQVLDEVLTYEVDQIRIVLPEIANELDLVEGEDYCTLVTCTPYGVNTHRLLVRGHRIENLKGPLRVTADAIKLDSKLVAPVVAAPILMVLLLWLLIHYRKRK